MQSSYTTDDISPAALQGSSRMPHGCLSLTVVRLAAAAAAVAERQRRRHGLHSGAVAACRRRCMIYCRPTAYLSPRRRFRMKTVRSFGGLTLAYNITGFPRSTRSTRYNASAHSAHKRTDRSRNLFYMYRMKYTMIVSVRMH